MKTIMLGSKLRIYALIYRLQEFEQDRIEEQQKFYLKPFERPPIGLIKLPDLRPLIQLYDKNGKPFEAPKSKYHK